MLVTFLCLLGPGTSRAAATRKSVAILPFTLNAPPGRQYLQAGLRDMLGSRIAAETGSVIIDKKDVDTALRKAGGRLTAKNMGAFARKVGADYLIFGSINALGAGMSVDARVFSAAAPAAKAVQTFYDTATSNDQIMGTIDSLSWDIIEKVFHKKRPAALAAAPEPAVAPAERSGMAGFATANPEKTFMASRGAYVYGMSGDRNFVKTRNFNMSLQDLALGDVDGDGRIDVILAGPHEVQVFHRDGTRLNLFATIKMGARYRIHSVNAADLNGNGRDEIYISAADAKIPGSRAVEWNGKRFVDLFREARWYIRPLRVPGMGLILAGQRAGLLPIEPGIFSLVQKDGKVRAGERLSIPAKINLFNFVYADLDGNGQHEIVALDNSFKLEVIKGGAVVWKSEGRYCGTKRYIGGYPSMMPGVSSSMNDEVDAFGEKYVETFIPSRILVSDVDHDGTDDIILNRNPSTLTAVLPREIQYKSGTIVGLKWNGLGLEEMWRTRKIDGYVVDYQAKSQVMKLQPGVADELFIGVVLNSGTLESLLGDQSTVVMYPFDFAKLKNNKQ
ncbi:MAG: VCBS repeat-containing protein [Deltaproteobacteria bacterium]|nr:VCBS repeat-containing protein [Deltaproteobacteria bacterium]